jgi:hypothetical protein
VRTVRRLAAIATLLLAGTAAAEPVIVLPKPRFNAPAGSPTMGSVRFEVVSSSALDPGRFVRAVQPRGIRLEGPDGSTRHLVVAPGRYVLDFRNYARPPRIAPGEREFVYEQVVWAKEAAPGVLYVETAHSTYARSSYGLNAYLSAIDLNRRKALWRSPALVANADNFVAVGDVIVSGYGFTDEPDYLYAVSRRTGQVVARLLLPSAPERIVRHGRTLTVDTYDHRVTVRVTGR